MSEATLTLVGNIVTEPVTRFTNAGEQVISFRMAANNGYYDRTLNEWKNSSTFYVSASCWGKIAERIHEKFQKGDPVIARGKLSTTDYEVDGVTRNDVDFKVAAIGPDMARSAFTVTRPIATDDTSIGHGKTGTEALAGALASPSAPPF